MGLDLFIFEKREEIKTSLDALNYLEEFSRYEEDKDYNSLEGCSPVITAWAKEMFKQFPPMNGEYALPDEIAFSSENIEDYLTDYTLGKHGAICSFSYNIIDDALDFLLDIFDEYNIGIYDFNNIDNIIGSDIEILKYKTESTNITPCTWNEVENSIYTLDNPERKSAYLSLWFDINGKDNSFLQCAPIYKEPSFFSRLFNKDKTAELSGYALEMKNDKNVYRTVIQNKKQLREIIKSWCFDRKLPDTSKYKKVSNL